MSTITLSSYDTSSMNHQWCHTTPSIGTITIGGGGTGSTTCYTSGVGGYTIGGAGGTYTIDTTSIFGHTEWENCFPDWNRIQEMCELYPGLKIAFEKFKTTYKLVRDDFDTAPDKRVKP